jgi:thymidine kinase
MRKGELHVHCGSMFSGKSTALLEELRRAEIAGMKVQLFKPSKDTVSVGQVKTHIGAHREAVMVKSASELRTLVEFDTDVIGIDEAQFFTSSMIAKVVKELVDSGKTVVVAGLDMDSDGDMFGFMPELMCQAEQLTKYRAVCVKCGEDAWISHAKFKKKEQSVPGAEDLYEPLCRSCYNSSEEAL